VFRLVIRIISKEKFNSKIVIAEPFYLPVKEDMKIWREDLDPKLEVIRKLAKEFKAPLVPLDNIFIQASKKAPMEYWLYDGVHPTPAGIGLIAQAWLKKVLHQN